MRGLCIVAVLLSSALAGAEGPCGLPAHLAVSAETRVDKDFLPNDRDVKWTGRYQEWSPWSATIDWSRKEATGTWRFAGQDRESDHALILADTAAHQVRYELDGTCSSVDGRVVLGIARATVDGQDVTGKINEWKQRWGANKFGVGVALRDGVVDEITLPAATSRVPDGFGGQLDMEVWRVLHPRTLPLNQMGNIFRISVRNATTGTPAEPPRVVQVQPPAAPPRNEPPSPEAQRAAFKERFIADNGHLFAPPPLPLTECSAQERLANPSRCARIDNGRNGTGTEVLLEQAYAEDDPSCPQGMRQVTFSCRMTPPADHGVCVSRSTTGSGAECKGAQSCCLSARSTQRVLAQSKQCQIRTCGFVAAGLTPQQEEKLCPALEAGAQCTLPPDRGPSLAHCPRSPIPPRPRPTAHHGGVWTAQACVQFFTDLDAAERAAGEEHHRDHEARLAAQAKGAQLPCPHVCRHPDELTTWSSKVEGLHRAIMAEYNRQRNKRACSSPLEQAMISASSIMHDLRMRIVDKIMTYHPPADDQYGPYWEWSTAPMGWRGHNENEARSLCESLAKFHECK